MESDFLDSMDDSASLAVDMKQLTAAASHLHELQVEYDLLMETLEDTKKRLDAFRHETLPQMMAMAGVSSITDLEGRTYKLVTKYHCSPNKNEGDQQLMVHWLREKGGGHLVKAVAKVDAEFLSELRRYEIPHKEETNVNTMSLKSWLIDIVGGKGGTIQVPIEEVPKILHFVGLPEVEVKE
jgi:hypothetical protein